MSYSYDRTMLVVEWHADGTYGVAASEFDFRGAASPAEAIALFAQELSRLDSSIQFRAMQMVHDGYSSLREAAEYIASAQIAPPESVPLPPVDDYGNPVFDDPPEDDNGFEDEDDDYDE